MFDAGQKNVLKIVSGTKVRNVLLWGSSRTGNYLLLCEALKVIASKHKLKREGKKVKIFATTSDFADLMTKKLRDQYTWAA